jgi:hypothetical protein
MPLIKFVLDQHVRSEMHEIATEQRVVSQAAPPEDHFRKVINSVRKRGGHSAITGVGGRMKVARMIRCLGDGARQLDRDFLATAQSITLLQDVRAGKLLIRFKAADANCVVRRGVLSLVKVVGGGLELKQAVIQGIGFFCSQPTAGGGSKLFC